MTYIEQMKNLREANRIIREGLPELSKLIEARAKRSPNPDLKLIFLSDDEFNAMKERCEDVEKKLYRFDHESECGIVETLSAAEKRGYYE